jgi:metallo-beta-lactamase family protein
LRSFATVSGRETFVPNQIATTRATHGNASSEVKARNATLSFLGGAGTVTGSRYLLRMGQTRILVDCGLFQGVKQLRLRNWEPFPVAPDTIDAVVLTHAHIDHSGYLPVLHRSGFRGPVYCTGATRDLCSILLRDSAHLQEEDARYANRHGYSRHRPARPLYTVEDVAAVLTQFRDVEFGTDISLGDVSLSFHRAGHILGAASVVLRSPGTSMLFSGDLGQPEDAIIQAPEPAVQCDYVVVESTYGDRSHVTADVESELGAAIRRAAARGGVTMIPAFAVGRAQLLLHYLARLSAQGAIPDIPIFLDSPLAEAATRLLSTHAGEHRLSSEQIAAIHARTVITHTVAESKSIDRRSGPMVIIAGSGMVTGGRILHHLKCFAGDHRNLILLAGFQVPGTRGAGLVSGARELKIHGNYYAVKAEVMQLQSVSAHADAKQIVEWLRPLARPKHCFITHGEPLAADSLRLRIEEQLSWSCSVPDHLAQVELP